jgi:hypothetical protein
MQNKKLDLKSQLAKKNLKLAGSRAILMEFISYMDWGIIIEK